MTLEYQSFSILSVGEVLNVGEYRFAWVQLSISLTDPETSAHPNVDIKVPIQYEPNWTIERIHQTAFDKALETLKTAVGLSEQHNLQGLQRLDDEREAAFRAEEDLHRS